MISCSCDCCGQEFESGRTRSGSKHCRRCAEYLRGIGVGPVQLKRQDSSNEPQQWFTVDEAAEYLRVSRRSVYQLVEEEQLISHRIAGDGHQRFSRYDLDDVMRLDGIVGQNVIIASEDSVLAELWDNEKDAAYDNI